MWEEQPETGQIRCKTCFEIDPIRTGWIGRENTSRHPRTDEHAKNAGRLLQRNQTNASHQAQLDASYTSITHSAFNTFIPDPVPPSRPDLLDDPDMPTLMEMEDDDYDHDHDDDDNDDDDNIFAEFYNEGVIPAGVNPIEKNPALERERLRHAMDLIRMEAEHTDMFGREEADNDETTTNVEDMFRELSESFGLLRRIIISGY